MSGSFCIFIFMLLFGVSEVFDRHLLYRTVLQTALLATVAGHAQISREAGCRMLGGSWWDSDSIPLDIIQTAKP